MSGRHVVYGLLALDCLCAPALRADPASGERTRASEIRRDESGHAPAALRAPVSPTADLPVITPTGVISLFGRTQVLFKVAPPARPGQPPAPETSFLMSTGDRRDGIEVAKINLQSTRITFNNHGVVQELRLAIAPVGGGPGVSDSSVDPAQPPVTADASGTHRPIQRHSGPILEGIVDSDQDPSADAGSVQPTILPPDQMANLVGTQPLNNQEKGDPNAQLALPAPSASPPSQLPEPAYQSAPATRPMSPGEPPTGGAAEWLAAGGDVPPPPPRNDF